MGRDRRHLSSGIGQPLSKGGIGQPLRPGLRYLGTGRASFIRWQGNGDRPLGRVHDVGPSRGRGRERIPGGEGAPPRHRALRRSVLALGILVIAFLTATAVLFVFPATDQPRQVGAILSLNGTDEAARASKAIALAEEGYLRYCCSRRAILRRRAPPCPVSAQPWPCQSGVFYCCTWSDSRRSAVRGRLRP